MVLFIDWLKNGNLWSYTVPGGNNQIHLFEIYTVLFQLKYK